MQHDYNTQSKIIHSLVVTQEDLTKSQQKIVYCINTSNSYPKDEISNVIKRLRGEKFQKVEQKIFNLESEQNLLAQHGRRNKIVIRGISESIDDSNIEYTVISAMSDIDVSVQERNIEVFHRFGKPAIRLKPKKSIILLLIERTARESSIRKKSSQIWIMKKISLVWVKKISMNETIASNVEVEA